MKTTYTDRRGGKWVYAARRSGQNPSSIPVNDVLMSMTNPLGKKDTFGFTNRLLTSFKDPLNPPWLYTYDNRGNLLTVTDPLNHQQAWTYNGNNTVSTYTDALGNMTNYAYDATLPTLLTSITEPIVPAEDAMGNVTNAPAVTSFEYYRTITDPNDPNFPGDEAFKHGLLRKVTDPNGVVTHFDYDLYGQRMLYAEGVTPTGNVNIYEELTTMDAGSRLLQATAGPGSTPLRAAGSSGSCGTCTWSSNNHVIRTGCCPLAPCCPFLGCCGASAVGSTCTVNGLSTPAVPPFVEDFSEMSFIRYTGLGVVERMDMKVTADELFGVSRTFFSSHDELNQPTMKEIRTGETGSPHLDRTFNYTYDRAAGTVTRTDTEGVETFVQLDTAGRVSLVRRGPAGSPLLMATYTYLANGLVDTITYGDGSRVVYTYDAANRVMSIDHTNINFGGVTGSLLRLSYNYLENDLPQFIIESRDGVDIAGTIFVYDARNRLTREIRVLLPSGTSVYDLTYTYDLGGNRRRKTDTVNQKEVIYIYDIDDPNSITANNRLMEYDTNSTAGGQTTAISTVFYCYNVNGNVTAVTRKWENPPAGVMPYRTTQFVYAKNQQAVTHVVGADWDGAGTTNYLYARGFRYDGARQRYLVREYDPDLLPSQIMLTNETWTDYDGDQPYGDFTVNGTVSNLKFHELGIGEVSDPLGVNQQTDYTRGDQIGTTRALDNGSSTGMASSSDVRVYTAFGELIDPGMNGLNRYGYAGAFGYEKFSVSELDDPTMTPNPADTVFPFLHVGARWYDPATGRFLQRDPIGINGGTNVYAYVGNTPT